MLCKLIEHLEARGLAVRKIEVNERSEDHLLGYVLCERPARYRYDRYVAWAFSVEDGGVEVSTYWGFYSDDWDAAVEVLRLRSDAFAERGA